MRQWLVRLIVAHFAAVPVWVRVWAWSNDQDNIVNRGKFDVRQFDR